MLRNRVLVLGGFLASALPIVGCGSNSSTPPQDGSSTGGNTGAGGGSGGAPADGGAGRDGGAAPDGAAGSGGAPADGGAGRDGGSDVAAADAADARSDGPTTCITSYGAGNPVQYAFNGGANAGWYQFLNDPANSGLTTSLGASFTEGRSCPGALQFAVNFAAYGLPNAQAPSGSTEIYYAATPNGRNWSTYKNLHAWIKVQTADYQQLAGVYFYVKSMTTKYNAAPVATGADLSNGQFHEVVVDLTNPGTGPFNGVVANDIQLIGFQVLLNMAPPTGAPATPSQAILLVDDIWLEALPPSDAGTDGGDDAAAGDAAPDAPTGG